MKNFKNIIAFLTISILMIQAGIAQTTSLSNAFYQYMKDRNAGDASATLQHLYQPALEYVSKRKLAEDLEDYRTQEEVVIKDPQIVDVSDFYLKNGLQFVLISFTQDVHIDLSELKETSTLIGNGVAMIVEGLLRKHGEGKAHFDSDTFEAFLKADAEVYGVFDSKTKIWKFIPDDEEFKDAKIAIIPKKLRELENNSPGELSAEIK
jgi:hypothetical protein